MPSGPQVILSGFADEAAYHKTAVEQLAVFAALGLQYYSLRYVDVGHGIKNVLELTKSEITKLRHLENQYEMNVASIGSPIGQIKLTDEQDGTPYEFVPFKKYLNTKVTKACDMAHAFETKLLRGFSFYPPQGADPQEYLEQAADQLGQIAEMCHRSDLTFGIEVKPHTVGQNGELLAALHRKVNHPAVVTIFNGGNLVSQGFAKDEVYQQYLALKPSLGWMQLKDFSLPNSVTASKLSEEGRLPHYVPVDQGDSGYARILADFKEVLPKLERKLKRRGIPGVVLDLAPHLKGADSYGGVSGPDGMAIALRALTKVLDFVGIGYELRDWEDVVTSRGF